MSRPLVKICGVSREEEIDDLAALGVDLFGLVVDVPSPWTITPQRARALSAYSRGRMRPTLVTRPHAPAELIELIQQTGVSAFQSPALNPPDYVREIRRAFAPQALTILQVISYRRGEFWKEDQIGDYLDAGADYVLVDPIRTADRNESQASSTIPAEALATLQQRHPGKPLVIAGGISAANVQSLLAASGAVGVDVCSAVRREGNIQRDLVECLLREISNARPPSHMRPSLRRFLQSVESANHVIAYLTLGDPADGFENVAAEVLEAGALTLELGFPAARPSEGAVLRASHARALEAGISTAEAMRLFEAIANRYPDRPLIAVTQWPAIESESEQEAFLDALAAARAAAILPVGLPTWKLPAFSASVQERGLETVIPCAPNATRKRRSLVYPYCSGSLYVPRGQVTGGGRPFGDDIAEFCRQVTTETDSPIIVGVGVKSFQDVAEICRTPATAAAVGSALVEHIAQGGDARKFISALIGNA